MAIASVHFGCSGISEDVGIGGCPQAFSREAAQDPVKRLICDDPLRGSQLHISDGYSVAIMKSIGELVMSEEPWKAVDDYLADLFVPDDPALTAALTESEAAGLDPISVSPMQGKLLNLLAQLKGGRRILEIGTLGGYSTIWMARALPEGGTLISLELQEKHAEVARKNVARAGLSDKVEIRVGAALDSLKTLESEGSAPFDLIFIDADKENIPGYFEGAMKLSRKGTLLIVDNVIRDGAVLEADSEDVSIQGVRRFNEVVAADSRVTTSTVQTVGCKGYDGFAMVLVTGD
jgi:predicted O-methyltransferase YrrM